ncbi:MAG: prepilin-type N-terminal cleavage/methylation domain-containing protein [candidate division Zixibacteria bacterium]|nr:prepilin-type N-terminal cleavage/methylation domain-containing protein [candidate division Zixibacteria bacterium]MDH3936169.1 prepilin-type N-terminal cleavage/methylation domain-containing protein [candidate division Zixibacteria bacterium]MDH4033374.1 prepilin-type N-terminal cleavage/methylation domain-containing protein [candidate division Zixibacteria bacterium]
MKNVIDKLKQVRGASLLEVLVALAITGVVTLAVFKAYITQHRHYIVQEDVTDIQQNARAAIDELSRHVRMAGHDLPMGMAAIAASNTNPDTITITYHTDACDTYISAPMPQPSAELKCGTDISCYWTGQWVYIYEPAVNIGEWFEITQVQEASMHLQHNTMQLSRKYGADSEILSLTQVKFYIDTTDTEHPNLMIQYMGQTPQVYSMNMTDLQFVYHMRNGDTLDAPILVDDIREIAISVTGRSNSPDPEAPDTSDVYRFRTFATSVYLRNLES